MRMRDVGMRFAHPNLHLDRAFSRDLSVPWGDRRGGGEKEEERKVWMGGESLEVHC